MPLKITKATDVIEVRDLTVCLYAVPGVGKTSMGFTAEKPLLLDFDRGSYRAKNRGDVVQVERWADVAAITAADLAPYKTLVVDTAGRALDALTADIIDGNAKMAYGGALNKQGYGLLKSTFVSWTKFVRSFGLDVVLLCHSDEQKNGDDLIERLDMQGGSKGEIYKCADMMGRIYLRGGKRILNFSPTDTAFGKNPGGFDPLVVPEYSEQPHFLAGVIQATKDELNKLSEAQTVAANAMGEWKAKVDECATCSDFDGVLALAKEAPKELHTNLKRMIAAGAKAKGFAFNKSTGAFDLAEPKEGKAA